MFHRPAVRIIIHGPNGEVETIEFPAIDIDEEDGIPPAWALEQPSEEHES